MKKSPFLLQYENFKQRHENHIILIQSGSFYVALDQDAKILSDICGLKIKTFTTRNISKCGFPVNALEKYVQIIIKHSYSVVIYKE